MTKAPSGIHCPSCGHAISTHAPVDALSGAPLPNMQRRIVDALARAYPREITVNGLIDICYSDDIDGGPDNPKGVLRTLLSRLRQRLPSYGWTIPSSKGGTGSYGRYRLAPVVTTKADNA